MERTSKNFMGNFYLGSVASYCSPRPVPLVILKSKKLSNHALLSAS